MLKRLLERFLRRRPTRGRPDRHARLLRLHNRAQQRRDAVRSGRERLTTF